MNERALQKGISQTSTLLLMLGISALPIGIRRIEVFLAKANGIQVTSMLIVPPVCFPIVLCMKIKFRMKFFISSKTEIFIFRFTLYYQHITATQI